MSPDGERGDGGVKGASSSYIAEVPPEIYYFEPKNQPQRSSTADGAQIGAVEAVQMAGPLPLGAAMRLIDTGQIVDATPVSVYDACGMNRPFSTMHD